MIYTIPYQCESLMKQHFFSIRGHMNELSDSIHLTIKGNSYEGLKEGEIYKTILKLDGQYRSFTDGWTLPPIKVQVITQL